MKRKMVVRPAYDVWFGEVGNNKKTGGRAEVSLIFIGMDKITHECGIRGTTHVEEFGARMKKTQD